jgi:hypothetical protein
VKVECTKALRLRQRVFTTMNKTFLVLALVTATLIQGISSANAQKIPSKIRNIIEDVLGVPKTSVDPEKTPSVYPDGGQTRAMNLARQAAEKANGGLNNYRAEQAMYGPASNAPFKDNGNGTLTFTFLGGRPAAAPTIKSVVTVSLQGDLVSLDSNESI